MKELFVKRETSLCVCGWVYRNRRKSFYFEGDEGDVKCTLLKENLIYEWSALSLVETSFIKITYNLFVFVMRVNNLKFDYLTFSLLTFSTLRVVALDFYIEFLKSTFFSSSENDFLWQLSLKIAYLQNNIIMLNTRAGIALRHF